MVADLYPRHGFVKTDEKEGGATRWAGRPRGLDSPRHAYSSHAGLSNRERGIYQCRT